MRLLQGGLDGKRYFVVNPLLDCRNMGLESVDVLLETHNLDGIETLERVAKYHPYTAYRCRCYGAMNGVFMQFRTPMKTSSRIRELVRTLKRKGVVNRYRFLTTANEPTIYTSLRIDGWDPKTLSWNFSWDRWFKKPVGRIRSQERNGPAGGALQWLTRRDLSILYELMKGARRKNIEIIRALAKAGIKFTPQTFSRRFKMLREHCIEGYRVTFDPSAFDIYSNVIIFGRGERDTLHKLRTRLQNRPIPFESTMRVSEDEIFWFLRLQPTHLSPLLASLYSQLNEMSVFLVDYSHSLIYYIWPETLDEDAHKWRTDRRFMIDDVLDAVLGRS